MKVSTEPSGFIRKAIFSRRNGVIARFSRAPPTTRGLHLLGIVMLQSRRLAAGVELIGKALAIKPDLRRRPQQSRQRVGESLIAPKRRS